MQMESGCGGFPGQFSKWAINAPTTYLADSPEVSFEGMRNMFAWTDPVWLDDEHPGFLYPPATVRASRLGRSKR
jgi:hypothetical protein